MIVEQGDPEVVLSNPSSERLECFLNLVLWGETSPAPTDNDRHTKE